MITIEKETFLNAIKAIKNFVGKNTFNPILATIHIKTENGGITLTASDTNNSARAVIEANITEEADFCVVADKLESIVNCLDGLITINLKEAQIVIKSKSARFQLLTLNSNDFPQTDFELSDEGITLTKEEFIRGVMQTAISTTEIGNNLLSGICFNFNENNYEMLAVDGNRLSRVVYDTPVNITGSYVIPAKFLNDVARNAGKEIKFYFKGNKIIAKTNNYLYSSFLLTGEFPACNSLIPKDQPIKITVNRNSLLKTLEKVSIMSDARSNFAKFVFNDNTLKITAASDNGEAEDVIDINFKDNFTIGFNYRLIFEGLKVMNTDDVVFEMSDDASPCVVKSDFTYLVMPMRR